MSIVDLSFFIKRNRIKNYLHFDKKIDNRKILEYVTDIEKIKKHSFLPTLSYRLNEKKICRKMSGSKKIRKDDYKEKNRLINFPCHLDGNIYAYYCKILDQYYENFLSENNLKDTVLAFRKVQKLDNDGRKYSLCNIHFARDVFEYIKNKQDCTVICLDISGFFDNLDHVVLKDMWCKAIGEKLLPLDHFKVYKSLTQYSYVEKDKLYKLLNLSLNSRRLHKRMERLCDIKTFRDQVRKNGLIKKNLRLKGIPQGSPISGMLSNIYMMEFDCIISQEIEKLNGKYFRYCDDMIFITDNQSTELIEKLILTQIDKIKLNINKKKTQTVIFEKGKVQISAMSPTFNFPVKLQYLGVSYDGKNVFLRETGLSKFHFKLRKAIRMRVGHYKKIEAKGHHRGHSIYMRTLHIRYTYIGSRNYVSYVYRVSKLFDSKNVKKQIKGHYNIFNNYLNGKLK